MSNRTSNAVAASRTAVRFVLATVTLGGIGFVSGCTREAPVTPELTAKWSDSTLYDIEATRLGGSEGSLADHRGQVTLVVNTASKCGFTPQFGGLQALHDRFADQGFSVLGFPSADFGGQELDTAEEIGAFCQENYGVEFPMFAKVVTSGDGQSAVYEYLGTETGDLPGWNFGKYLVGRDGTPIKFFASNVKPDSDDLVAAIEAALATDAAG
ncbi:MAG: glutathione peroxidase [Phycisphaerales bacterium]